MKTSLLVCLVAVLGAAVAAAAEPVRVPATRDNSIVLVDNEWRDNAGRQSHIRIKGNQHMLAMMFDAQPLRGRVIRSATLVCQKGDGNIAGLTLSTIMCDWDEHKSNALTSGMQTADGWGYTGARFPAITGGNAFSLLCQAPSVVRDGAYHWQVHPDLVQAIALGAAWGLTLHEVDADYSRNPTIFSREQSGRGPYLEVTFGDSDPPPQPPTDLAVAGDDLQSLRLRLRAPKNGFLYEVTVNGAPLPRWNIPFVRPGEAQVIPIRDVPLKAGEPVRVQVTTVNRTGLRSDTVTAASPAFAAPRQDFPAVPAVAAATTGQPPKDLAVIPLEDKYDAAGKPVGNLPADYRTCNGVFDGRTVRLAAARGEVVGFQMLVKGNGRVKVACDLPGLRVDLWRAVYVDAGKGRRIPDPLVPLEDLDLSPDEAAVVCADVYVPFEFAEREVAGTIGLSDGRKLPVLLAVRPFAIPRTASFLCEMNGYGLPDRASQFYRLQEIAYDHRTHVNLLAYGHSSTAPNSRKCVMDMTMDNGRRMDEKRYNEIAPGAKQGYWDDFAAVFGPYLSGSHFKNGHRGPVPAPGFYLTFHESWPLKVREFSSGSPDAYDAFKAKPAYAETFVNIMQDFLRVAEREGWSKAGFQVYLNNKGRLTDPNKAPWTLDEPVDYWDYRALAYYDDLVRKARGPAAPGGPAATVQYRIDISRPEFDRGQLAGKSDLWVVSSSAFHHYRRPVTDRAEATGLRIWVYGTTNQVEQTNRTVGGWVLDAYRGGARGVVPWQTVNRDGSAMTKADQLGLFIFTKTAAGEPVIRHSMRLAAYRRAEQDVEYLELLRAKRGLGEAALGRFIDHYLNLEGTVATAYAEDAGTPEYGQVTPESLRQLREAAAAALAAP